MLKTQIYHSVCASSPLLYVLYQKEITLTIDSYNAWPLFIWRIFSILLMCWHYSIHVINLFRICNNLENSKNIWVGDIERVTVRLLYLRKTSLKEVKFIATTELNQLIS